MLEIASFEKMYPKSGWYSDVEELRIGLTNQVSPALVGAIQAPMPPPAPPAPPSPMAAGAPPAPPAPPEPYSRAMAASRAAQVRAPRAPGARGQSENPEVSLQQEVLRVLFQQDPDHAIDISTERLKSDPADPVVLSNLYMVANSKSDKALPLLLNIAKSSSSDEARKDAIFWISRSRGDKDALMDTLVGLMPSLTSEEDSMSLVFALSQLNTPKSTDLLVTMARDKNRPEKVRMSAIQWLANSKSPNRVTFLDDIYKSSMDDVRIRRQVLQGIAMTRDPAAVGVLSNVAATDPDQDTRREAVNALGQIKSPEALKALEDLLRKKPQ
jgi:HEAT repeat protein